MAVAAAGRAVAGCSTYWTTALLCIQVTVPGLGPAVSSGEGACIEKRESGGGAGGCANVCGGVQMCVPNACT